MTKSLNLTALLVIALQLLHAQSITGKVVDANTYQPLQGVSIAAYNKASTITDKNGFYSITAAIGIDTLQVSFVGYQTQTVAVSGTIATVLLAPLFSHLNEVIVSGSREAQKRTEVPAAITVLSKALINNTKATRLDMLLNKVPGVFMVDLGNEQHSMSMRQPLGYGSLFLYLEDGIPIRTVGDFNHNALIEINQASLERIEVIKGPASSLYGSEAVGGAINFITQAPSAFLAGKVQAEIGSRGYKRTDFSVSNTYKKWGFFAGGYYAAQHQMVNEHNNFKKAALTLRADYTFNPTTKLTTVADYIDYKTDQKGGLDSTHFYNKDYISFYRFTYRKVDAFRLRSTLTKQWSERATTSFTVFYRNTVIGQNPFYSISNVQGVVNKATGQINKDAFNSYGTVIQHSKKIKRLNAKWITGISIDYSPASYRAQYIDIDKDAAGVYYNYTVTDSVLTHYNVDLLNTAAYTQFEYTPVQQLKLVIAARYDRLDYNFDNFLPLSAYSGAPDATNHFDQFTPKVGATYNFGKGRGLYVNYSTGFAPPNITDLYRGVKVPVLKPSSYNNYEVGGWYGFANGKGYAEASIYKLRGTNEIVNVRLPDGTYANQNAGATLHKGIEVNIKYSFAESLLLRVGGTYAQHKYISFLQQNKEYSGNIMAQAPPYIINGEITYKPVYIKNMRIALEYQGLGRYFTDAANTAQYNGFSIFNARMGYAIKQVELWLNCINLANKTYATTVEKSTYGTTYRPGQLRTFNIGIAYHFNEKQ